MKWRSEQERAGVHHDMAGPSPVTSADSVHPLALTALPAGVVGAGLCRRTRAADELVLQLHARPWPDRCDHDTSTGTVHVLRLSRLSGRSVGGWTAETAQNSSLLHAITALHTIDHKLPMDNHGRADAVTAFFCFMCPFSHPQEARPTSGCRLCRSNRCRHAGPRDVGQ